MNVIKKILTYLKHLSFICFLYACIIFYPAFDNILYGNIYLIIFIIYVIVTFISFFAKSSAEENNILNSILICILHGYFIFLAIDYNNIISYSTAQLTTFNFNYFVIAFSMIIIIINKIILLYSK